MSRSLNYRRTLSLLLLSAYISVTVSACGEGKNPTDGANSRERAVVVATTTQVADLVRNVGGQRIELRQILQVSSDPHSYEPKPSDVKALGDAQAVFSSGGDLDSWIEELAQGSGTDTEPVELIDATKTLHGDSHHSHDHEEESEHGSEETHSRNSDSELDPHWWQDPRNAQLAVKRIEQQLSKVDPEGSPHYQERADKYLVQLRRLDRSIASCITKIPKQQRKLVTNHDALGYFTERYGIETVGTVIPSLSTQAQASAGDVAKLIEQIRSQHVKAVFPESSISAKLERSIAEETGAKVGQPLWTDALGPPDSGGATYIDSMEANAQAIASGLTEGKQACRF